MVAVCSGGSAQIKPTFGSGAVITLAAAEAALTFVSEGLALILAPAIAGLTYDLTTICTTDPPSDPGLTPQDLLDLVNTTDAVASLAAATKVGQWFLSWYWYQACECTSVTTPNAPIPSVPTSIPTINPGIPGAVSGICFRGNASDDWPNPASSITNHDLTQKLLPTAGNPTIITGVPIGDNVISVPVWPIPSGMTKVTFNTIVNQYDIPKGVGGRTSGAFVTYNSATSGVSAPTPVQSNVTDPRTLSFTPTSGHGLWEPSATHWGVISNRLHQTGTVVDEIDSWQSEVFCGGGGSTGVCCPPDPLIDFRLNQIWGMVQAIFAGLPAKIGSWIESTVHAGLSGSGHVTIGSTASALKVSITTTPSYLGRDLGDPTVLFDAGFITTSAAEGNYKTVRLETSPQLVLLSPVTDQFHWTLPAGVVISVTELIAGP